MNKCKNCGSTAQFKKVHVQYVDNDLKKGIVEVYECQGCGYTENMLYAFDCAEGRTADRVLIYSDRRKCK